MNKLAERDASRARTNSGSGDALPPPRSSYAPSPRSSPSPATFSNAHVFVNIVPEEREAFFSLLDQYFESRPQYKELFAQGGAPTPAARAPVAKAALPFRQPAVVPPAAPIRRGLGTATALYDYEGAEGEDLSLKEGEKVTITEHGGFAHWAKRERGC